MAQTRGVIEKVYVFEHLVKNRHKRRKQKRWQKRVSAVHIQIKKVFYDSRFVFKINNEREREKEKKRYSCRTIKEL